MAESTSPMPAAWVPPCTTTLWEDMLLAALGNLLEPCATRNQCTAELPMNAVLQLGFASYCGPPAFRDEDVPFNTRRGTSKCEHKALQHKKDLNVDDAIPALEERPTGRAICTSPDQGANQGLKRTAARRPDHSIHNLSKRFPSPFDAFVYAPPTPSG